MGVESEELTLSCLTQRVYFAKKKGNPVEDKNQPQPSSFLLNIIKETRGKGRHSSSSSKREKKKEEEEWTWKNVMMSDVGNMFCTMYEKMKDCLL